MAKDDENEKMEINDHLPAIGEVNGKRVGIFGFWLLSVAVYFLLNWLYPTRIRSFENPDTLSSTTRFILLGFTIVAVYGLGWINIVWEWNRRPMMRFGKYIETLSAGLHLREPLFNTFLTDIPIRDLVMILPIKMVLTKDNVGISFNGVVTFCIPESLIKDSVMNVANLTKSLQERGFSTLSDQTAMTDLNSILEHREVFSKWLLTMLTTRVSDWGVRIKNVEIKEFNIVDPVIANAIALKAKAVKEGEAELARAEYQLRIAKKLSEAGEALSDKGMWCKWIEALMEMTRSGTNNSFLVLPSNPVDMVSSFFGKSFAKTSTIPPQD